MYLTFEKKHNELIADDGRFKNEIDAYLMNVVPTKRFPDLSESLIGCCVKKKKEHRISMLRNAVFNRCYLFDF